MIPSCENSFIRMWFHVLADTCIRCNIGKLLVRKKSKTKVQGTAYSSPGNPTDVLNPKQVGGKYMRKTANGNTNTVQCTASPVCHNSFFL